MIGHAIEKNDVMGVTVDLSAFPFLDEALEREHSRGEVVGMKRLLLTTLRARFGEDAVSQDVEAMIDDLNDDAIERMQRSALKHDTIEKVLGLYAPSAGFRYG